MNEFKRELQKRFAMFPDQQRERILRHKDEIIKELTWHLKDTADRGFRFYETETTEFVIDYYKRFCRENGLEMHADKTMQNQVESMARYTVRISGWDEV